MDIWEYFLQKEAEYNSLGLRPDRAVDELFTALEGYGDRRGRVFGNLWLTDDAFLSVSELVEIVNRRYARRIEYGYFLVIDGIDVFGEERDLSHDPAVHRHTEGHTKRVSSNPISFKKVVATAWKEITYRTTLAPID